jgi:hypothetical protein
MSGAIPLLPLYALIVWTGKTLTLPFTRTQIEVSDQQHYLLPH